MPRTRTSPTTPTIVRSARPKRKRRPSAPSPGQYRRAKDSLTTATNGEARHVRRRDVAPGPERNPHRREVARRHEAQARRAGCVAVVGVALQDDGLDHPARHHRQEADVGRVRDAGQRARLGRARGRRSCSADFRLLVVRNRQRRAQREHAVGAEPRIGRLQPPERAQEQPRGDEQDDRRRSPRRRRARRAAAPSRGRRPCARPPAVPPAPRRRRRAGRAARRSRSRSPPSAAAAIASTPQVHAADVSAIGKRVRDEARDEGPAAAARSDAEHAAADREHQALGQELPHEPLASGAHGGAHGQLPAAGERAREQQVRQVRAARSGARRAAAPKSATRSRRACGDTSSRRRMTVAPMRRSPWDTRARAARRRGASPPGPVRARRRASAARRIAGTVVVRSAKSSLGEPERRPELGVRGRESGSRAASRRRRRTARRRG